MEQEILKQRTSEVSTIVGHISTEKDVLQEKIADPQKTLRTLRSEDRDKFHYFFNLAERRFDEAAFSEKSPFFVRLELQFDDKPEREIVYIGKFSFLQDSIYSWTAPVAELRFAMPGNFAYTRPNGQVRSGRVFDREDYFIANGLIVSLHQITSQGRITVYDEQLEIKKKEYGLSDIVRELERAQNEIILLDPRGLMTISGPAGSGKTTLALHRLAYLLQNPDTSEWYKPEKTIVFIQDESSIAYFSSLFKNLGVDGVQFMSFESWCSLHLDLPASITFSDRYGSDGKMRDWIEWNKVKAVKELGVDMKYATDPWKLLRAAYKDVPDGLFKAEFKKQQQEKILDKQDITALLKIYLATHKGVLHRSRPMRKKKGGEWIIDKVRVPVSYDAVLVDEFENYTADQLRIIRNTFSKNASGLFVGDANQQTRFGSIASSSENELNISDARNIVLGKVYRNSSAVLQLLDSLGYGISGQIKKDESGGAEWITVQSSEYEKNISRIITKYPEQHIGIVCCDPDELDIIKNNYKGLEYVHAGTVPEMQGLEFETVIVLGLHASWFHSTGFDALFDQERNRILREQVYVAITRARNNIIVLSDMTKDSIVEILKK